MTQGHHALTVKEKQALRLLTSGHDAKTMAAYLGLSVHTVNERLRDARRKLGTSSSREAARQLRDLESALPENSVDNSLGDAPPPIIATHQPGQSLRQMKWRRPDWIYGGIAMSLALVVLALVTSTPTQTATPTPASATTAESAPVTAGRQWLALVDTGNWDASWDATGQSFKALNTSAKWAETSTQVRPPLGATKSRDLISAEFVPAPPYGYWIVKFRTNYANKANATETLSLMRENDSWRVVGVTID